MEKNGKEEKEKRKQYPAGMGFYQLSSTRRDLVRVVLW